MSAPFGSDPWLDARLRNVPLPEGILVRLKRLGKAPEEPAEGTSGPRLFRPNHPVPLGPSITDEQIDALVGDIEIPTGLDKRLRRISQERQPRLTYRRMLAIAATVCVAASLGLVWQMGLIDLHGVGFQVDRRVAAHGNRPNGGAESAIPVKPAGETPLDAIDILDPADGRESQQEIEDLRWQLAKQANVPIYVPDNISVPDPVIKPRLDKKTVFASDRSYDRLPELDAVAWNETPRGILPPMVPGYDFKFRARYGQHPFVVPAMHKELQSLQVPLVTRSTNYLQAWQALADRKLLSGGDVHVEELLAAVDYGFPPAPAGTLQLYASGGVSPLSLSGMKLLQVGVQTGPMATRSRQGTSLVVVVDTSSSMRRDGRLAMVRRALADLTSQLADTDRLTIIASGQESRPLVEGGSREQLVSILAAVKSLEPVEVTNLGASLETAFASASDRKAIQDKSARVVLITDGLTDLSADAGQRVRQLVMDSAVQGLALDVLQLSGARSGSADLLKSMAQAGGGELRLASDADTARFALLETLTGHSQTVAKEASLKITFNPKVVARYRLIGHECFSLTGSTGAALSVELRGGETATGLLEVQLLPKGGNDVATIELTWRNATTGQLQKTTQHLKQAQFAPSFASESAALQAATIVALAGEKLRGSYFLGSNRSLGAVLDLADQAKPEVVERPSMKSFLAFVAQAEKVRLGGAGR